MSPTPRGMTATPVMPRLLVHGHAVRRWRERISPDDNGLVEIAIRHIAMNGTFSRSIENIAPRAGVYYATHPGFPEVVVELRDPEAKGRFLAVTVLTREMCRRAEP
jgi:hypothetical protein